MGKEDKLIDKTYYIDRKPGLLKKYDEEALIWRPVAIGHYGEETTEGLLRESREEFEDLIPQIPYIGGEENRRTESLLASAIYLAFYKAMKRYGKTAEETGKILFDAILTQVEKPRPLYQEAEGLTPEEYMEVRRKGAEQSQQRRFQQDFVYELVVGDGKEFDYGYDYTECASQKFFHEQGANEFMPFYCYLDFPLCRVYGIGLTRTLTMSEGHKICNHRIKLDCETVVAWPPSFLKRKKTS